MACFPGVDLLGVWIDDADEAEVIEHLVASVRSGRGGRVVTPNVDILRQAVRDPHLRALVAEADVTVADGMPIVWASRLQGTPLRARVPTSELVYPLATAAAENGLSLFLLGDTEQVARAAASRLIAHAPGLRIAGTYSPSFGAERDQREQAKIAELISQGGADFVLCAFGFPKQEKLMAALQPRAPGVWFISAGATLSMVAGRTPSAPTWMRRNGLEWMHRLRLEPSRLFGRYVARDAPFAIWMLMASAGRRFGRRSRAWKAAAAESEP
jgi:N-acetylglucosaminyldiphosphoundecaprenol N-acetyl-beta-D-mannosaminyltransferase